MSFYWLLVAFLGVWLELVNASKSDGVETSVFGTRREGNDYEMIDFFQPEQTHLAFGDTVKEIVVTWSTYNYTPASIVEFGVAAGGSLNQTSKGFYRLFVDDGPEKRFQFIHRVTLKNLQPKTKYMYHCGSNLGWSALYFFTTVDFGTEWSPKVIAYGDLGNYNARSLPFLQDDIIRNTYSAILHVGDLAYDMHDDNGAVGDEFMNQIAPVAGYVPYMVSPGNHENTYNFSHYKNRFTMPGPYENLMYSWNLGPIHFISLNTEAYYFIEYGIKQLILQYEWLENDLKEANKPENRAVRPWIITYGHRPMYCSYIDPDCPQYSSRIRDGLPLFNFFGLEKLLYDNGVDFEIWAHEHSYSRLWPVYDHTILNGSTSQPYVNPKGPVHIITGSAGCHDHYYPHPKEPLPWYAFRSSDYGYTRLQAFNSTHLYWEQVSINKDGEIVDSNWLIKDHHGKY